MRKKMTIVFAVLLALAFVSASFAQDKVDWYCVDQGFQVSTEGASKLVSLVGQRIVGRTTVTDEIESGFLVHPNLEEGTVLINDVLVISRNVHFSILNPSDKITMRFNQDLAQKVRISVLNVQGQQVGVLADGKLPAGDHSFKLNQDVNPGIYLIKIESKTYNRSARVIVAK